MKRILKAYCEVMNIIFTERPYLVILCILTAACSGIFGFFSVYVNENIFSKGIEVAKGSYSFQAYSIYLILFICCALIPQICSSIMMTYIEPESNLFLRTSYKGKMLKKLEKLKYEHFENESSMEIIDKAYSRAEEAAMHLFPKYIYRVIVSCICVVGIMLQLCKASWWLLLTLLIPYMIETYNTYKSNFDIYEEMETYWCRERQYRSLGEILTSKEFIKENILNRCSDFLVNIYRKRLNGRNREYEKYYFYYIKKLFLGKGISRTAQIVNAILLFQLYKNGNINIGQLIAFTTAIFGNLWFSLDDAASVVKWSGHHINAFDYYKMYFDLSEEVCGERYEMPTENSIEFNDVCFKYPGTEKMVLNHVTFKINQGEKVSIVGENGGGKTTLIKLLLGLYEPDSGEILVGGYPLKSYTRNVRKKIFGTVFQDFSRYAISLKENVGVGNVEYINNRAAIDAAIAKSKVSDFVHTLPQGKETLLSREFDKGIDLSGGQWQRIAIARAFMGDKPILILDEPTSQLDPMAESELYSEFMDMSKDKTSIFVTHRLGSTAITDRIFVLSHGNIVQTGSHDELIAEGGIYADMFEAQKQWYIKKEGGSDCE